VSVDDDPDAGAGPGAVLWRPDPDRAAATPMARFAASMAMRHGVPLADGAALHAWSIREPEAFWDGVRDDAGARMHQPAGAAVLLDADRMPGARWYPEARLNIAESLLFGGPDRSGGAGRADGDEAIVFRGEDGATRRLTQAELVAAVTRLAAALAADGVGAGDRVAGFLPNIPEAVIAMLAVASLGGTWSSCSPDFGLEGVHDRFGQIEPQVLFVTDAYRYAGRVHGCDATVQALAERLPSLRRIVRIGFVAPDPAPLPGRAGELCSGWADYLDAAAARPLSFAALPFDHPLYILYSSGTTGAPKCIVHGAGGTLLQHLKEHRLHAGVEPGDRVFFFTTCGWMMWNWLVSGLAAGATLLLYDGSPFHPDGHTLWRYASEERCTHFGTSAKFIDACAKAGLAPGEDHDLSAVRVLMSTGSTLLPESFDYVYERVSHDVCLSSMSGGTDIVSCFALGDPTRPVRRGELQALGLGMDVRAFDADGRAVPVGGTGELVCVAPFPAMPTGFFGDDDGSRYRAAYFARYPGVWCHGDWVTPTAHGGLVIHGRSDATLNPGGVRIGTSEIYRQVETLSEVTEAIVVGQSWQGDTRVVLFVKLAEGAVLDEALQRTIRQRIRTGASPRHVPARICAVTDIPRTRSGKIVELAVRRVVEGLDVDNVAALANPEALEQYRDREELGT